MQKSILVDYAHNWFKSRCMKRMRLMVIMQEQEKYIKIDYKIMKYLQTRI